MLTKTSIGRGRAMKMRYFSTCSRVMLCSLWTVFLSIQTVSSIHTEGFLYASIGDFHNITVSDILSQKSSLVGIKQYLPDWKYCKIYIQSYGGSDPGVNRLMTKIVVDGDIFETLQTGFILVQMSLGKRATSATFDTHRVHGAGKKMTKYLLSIKYGTLVLVAAHDDATWRGYDDNVKAALRTVGARDTDLAYRGSYCLISFKGRGSSQRIQEVTKKETKGPSICSASFLLKFTSEVG